ncbi:hypothetical protein EJ03DRAFT_325962 [Teratosphaeria nubilosa]|uniref:Uncharacterized protein n=1 Tax=Teratosphaeria nubilosa TaxID=161662 RepID=A0A6G1LEW7_9PEZI|nr:hypothetical protein EJ03DRAFT_325962 [Teratosphaeria nubilosa]
MFSLKALPVLLLCTLHCYALLVPLQGNHEAGELHSPAMLQARNELVKRDPLDALEAEAIEHAKRGDFEKYHENAIRAARLSGNAELIASAEGPRKRDAPVTLDATRCLVAGRWHIRPGTALACWDATYRSPRRDPNAHVINTARAILMQHGLGRELAATEGAKHLLRRAREADEARVAREAEEAATKRLARKSLRDRESGVELYVERRSSDLATRDGSLALDLFGIHISWRFLEKIGDFISAIAAVIVAGTVCIESYLEPPAFLLMAAVVYTLCGGLVIEIAPAIIDLVAVITHG